MSRYGGENLVIGRSLPTSGQTADVSIPGASLEEIEIEALVKSANVGDTDILPRINGASTSIAYSALFSTSLLMVTGSSLGILKASGGITKIILTMSVKTGQIRIATGQSVTFDSAGAFSSSRMGLSFRWSDTSTQITSVGIDVGAGQAFASGSRITVRRKPT